MSSRLLALLCCLLCCGLASPVLGRNLLAEVQTAQAALAAGDYATAFQEYQRVAAATQNPLAQFTLGLFWQQGWGCPVDPVAACQWFERAAAGHIPRAAHELGECWLRGLHQPADPAQAAIWFTRAAEDGHALSRCALAALYMTGNGVPKDPAKGIALCRSVAVQGSVPAMKHLGRLLLQRDDGPVDVDAAFAWFEQAAQRQDPEAQYILGQMYREGRGRPVDLLRARHWFEAAAAQGYRPAYFPTAILYTGVPFDPATQQPSAVEAAKAYLWLSATVQRAQEPDQVTAATHLLVYWRTVIPSTWFTSLDATVAQHLTQHPVASTAPTGTVP